MENNETLDTMKQFLLKQPRNITMAKHKLGIHQMRILARCVGKLQGKMSFEVDHEKAAEDVWLSVRCSELVVGSNYKPLREALNGLIKKVVTIMHYIPDEANFLEIGLPLIQGYEYKHGSSVVKIQIAGRLIPQFIDLARGYTKYSVNVAFSTSSATSFKLYQYISSFRDKKQIQLNVSTLREWLELDDKYKMPKSIKQRILDPAIKELKEVADVWFTIAERVTEGRKMKGWKFNIHTKKEAKKSNPTLIEEKSKESLSEQKKVEVSQEKTIENESKEKAITSWDICLDIIKENINTKAFDTWFKPIKAHKYEQDELTILVPSEFFADWIKKNYAKLLQKAASFLGDDLKIKIAIEDTKNSIKPLEKKQAGSIRGVLANDFLLLEDKIEKIVDYIENPKTTFQNSEICKKTILKMAAWVKNNDKIGAPDKLIIKRLSEKFGIKF